MSGEKTEMMQSGTTEGADGTGPEKKKKWLPYILAAAAVLLVLAAGIGIYNTPANRLQRQLDLGNRYLEEQQYTEAALAFEQAIAIDDRCMSAYEGGLEAYLGAGDVSGAQDFYERTLTMLAGLDGAFADENRESIVGLYLAADRIYENDPEKVAQILETGYARTGEDARIKEKLIETCLEIAKEKTRGSAYTEALTVYDRLLELDSAKAETIDGLCDCLNKYIDVLMKEKSYEEIRALAQKYGEAASGVDFTSILEKIAELEKRESENRAFMKKVYDLMAAQDYEAMRELDGAEETAALAERIAADPYLYFPDENRSNSGIGVGIYLYEDDEEEVTRIYYYGDYADGKRKGDGTEFAGTDTGYYLFSGVWDQDAPNGEGTETSVGDLASNNDVRYDKVSRGTLVDGLWEGQVESVLTDSRDKESYDLSFSAVNGMPTEDKTEAYLADVWWASRPEAGEYIYAYDYHYYPDGSSWSWWSHIGEGEYIGVGEFGD